MVSPFTVNGKRFKPPQQNKLPPYIKAACLPLPTHLQSHPLMDPLPVDVSQLQRRDPAAWTTLLSRTTSLRDVIVTAVTSEPLWSAFLAKGGRTSATWSRRVTRFTLTLDGCSDPVTFIGKRTNAVEALIYQDLFERLPDILAAPHYVHLAGDLSWLLLEDVPNHFPPSVWTTDESDSAIEALAQVHAAFWEADAREDGHDLEWLPHTFGRADENMTWDELRDANAIYFDEGPGAIVSEHAIASSGRLAPKLMEAANGLVVMRDLGGWPGVLGESHLSAIADLLDDPVPMLSALDDQPHTLLHGSPQPYHWRATLFDEMYLVDWREATYGPAALDLIALIEGLPIVFAVNEMARSIFSDDRSSNRSGEPHLKVRPMSPLAEETLVDSYILSMAAVLEGGFPARDFRQSLPAARCLHVLTTWFPYFATWHGDMPNRYVWQRTNRMTEDELAELGFGPMVGVRPYLAGVFDRFMQAYRSL